MDVGVGLKSLDHPTRHLICNLCRQFYDLGWVTGTGGGIAIREGEEILVAPSGVQKERLKPEDLFVVDIEGKVLRPPKDPSLKLSECWPLFQHAFVKRGAGAIIHSHSINAVLITQSSVSPFAVGGFEMVKGLRGKTYPNVVEIPIISNTPHECDLADSLGEAMDDHPDVDAVLVRNHGVYVWGETWEQAKTQAECLDYLFELSYRLRR